MTTPAEYWRQVRDVKPELPEAVPEAWAFGATPEHADELLALVLAGTKTSTASSLWDFEATGEAMPREGEHSILLDGAGEPRAVIETTQVRIRPFDEVDARHAHAEGEGDRTLAHWRAVHERFWREYSENPRGFEPDMPVVCEAFVLVYSCAGAASCRRASASCSPRA
jgi:histidinol-phosphate aminotransferase